MNAANQERSDAARAGEAIASQYQNVLDGWAQVSRCCLEACDDMYHTGIEYVKEQAERMHEIACDPGAAMREETYSSAINSSFDAADRIAQAYLHSLETAREPLMRVVSAQLPMSRTIAGAMEKGMQRSMETMQKGAERVERTMRSTAHAAERGVEEGRHHAHHGKRKSA